MSKSRMPLYLGFAAAGAGGYYLYNAGGDPEAAKNQIKGMHHYISTRTSWSDISSSRRWKGTREDPWQRQRREVWQRCRQGGWLQYRWRRKSSRNSGRWTRIILTLTFYRSPEPVLRARRFPNTPKKAKISLTNSVTMRKPISMPVWTRSTAKWIKWIARLSRRRPRPRARSLAGLARNKLHRRYSAI